MALTAFALMAGYLLGTLPTAVVVARRSGHDPNCEGSGNPGASNVYRTAGRRAGAAVLAGDLVKGALAAGVGWALGGHLVGLAAGAAAVLGHVAPVVRRRPGGKGVATAAGAVLVLFPLVGLVAAVLWALVARLWRRPSVASLGVAAGVPIGVAGRGAPWAEVVLLALVAAVVVARHAANIARLARGTEAPLEVPRP